MDKPGKKNEKFTEEKYGHYKNTAVPNSLKCLKRHTRDIFCIEKSTNQIYDILKEGKYYKDESHEKSNT